MKSLYSVFHHKSILLTAISWGWLEVVAIPNPMGLLLLFGAMITDLVTGLIKSWSKGEVTTSNGFRKTVTKIGAYVGVIIGVWLLANIMNSVYHTSMDYTVVVNACVGFLSFIELYSIFENVYEFAPDSVLSRKLIAPVLRFLKGKLERNPLDNLLKKDDDGSETKKDQPGAV